MAKCLPTATVVAHENAKAAIIGEKRPTSRTECHLLRQPDDRAWWQDGGAALCRAQPFDNSIVMRFPAERVLFAVDFIPVKAVYFRDFQMPISLTG